MKHSTEFENLVREAKQRVREVTRDDVQKKITSGQRFHLIDVREDHEWSAGRIPTAIHIGRGILERDIVDKIPDKGAEIVLYCGGGYRSALAADNLQKMGYTKVYSMEGGFRGWKEKNFPIG